MADKVKRTPAKLSKLVEDFDMEIVCRGSDYDQVLIPLDAQHLKISAVEFPPS